MTTSSAITSTTSTTRTAGAVALAVAGLIDVVTAVVSLAGGSGDDSAPTAVLITLIVVGLVSGAALVGGRGALIAAYVARVVSAALGIPAFFLDAPVWVDVLVALGLVLSVAGIWLTVPALRRRPAVG
jgi:hypothetical protein